MSLVTNAKELNIHDYVTISQASRIKNVAYDSMRMWLRNNPTKVTTRRVGRSVLVYIYDLEKYTPSR